MPVCPQCNVAYDAEGAVDRCPSCGSFIPRAGTVQPAWSESRLAGSIPGGPPTTASDELYSKSSADDDRPSSELIRPRNLSSEFAAHVSEHWARTDEYKPRNETIHSHADTTEQAEDLLIGMRSVVNVEDEQRGDYILTETIGEGGMGVVWSARQSSLNRDVALKYPRRKDGQTERQQNKFIFEVVVTGKLDHPNIVPIYDLARDSEGRLFYAMKRVDGRPWNQCIHDGSLSFEENLEILMKVCDAIRFAHDRDVIHCDIKPHNIMVGRYGEVSVMDFGAAVRLVNGVAAASAGGTFSYMAPEIASDSRGQLGPATDVYLLGAVLYEIITREPPHPPPTHSDSDREMFDAAAMIAARNDITPIGGGGELAEIAHKALATDISDRYQRVDDFQRALRDYLSHSESIKLSEHGRQLLRDAMSTEDHGGKAPGARFDEFDRARFAFEEAIKLWSDNEPAKRGLAEATLASAQYALKEKAFSRGIALLNASNPDHAKLLGQLNAAQRRTNRLATMLQAAGVVIIVGGAIFSAFLYKANLEAKANELKAENSAKKALGAQGDAERSANEARKNAKEADENAYTALFAMFLAADNEQTARENADKARHEQGIAEENKKAAIQSAYASEIGVAEKALQRNAFNTVNAILDTQKTDPIKNKLRGWEWGYLNYLANDQPIEKFPDKDQPVEAAAISEDGRYVVAGSVDGWVEVWSRNVTSDSSLQSLRKRLYGTSVRSVAVAKIGDEYLIAAAGSERNADRTHHVKIWKVNSRDEIQLASTNASHREMILSVAFSKDGRHLLTSSADGTAVLWNLDTKQKAQEAITFHVTDGPRNVSSAQFSPGERWVVTASDDGKVCVWDASENSDSKGKKWEQFSDHKHPVLTARFLPNRAAHRPIAAVYRLWGSKRSPACRNI